MRTFHAVACMDHSEADAVMFGREYLQAQRAAKCAAVIIRPLLRGFS